MRILLVFALMTALAFAGCSDDGDDGPTTTASTTGPGIAPMPDVVDLMVTAVGTYPVNPAFDPTELMVPAGALVNVTFRNEDTVPVMEHNWVVEGIEGASSASIASGTETVLNFTAPLEAGDYPFYCSIGDHRDRGMEGTLTVVIP